MKNNKTTGKSIIELVREAIKTNKFQPKVKESSGLPDDLTDEEIRELIEKHKVVLTLKEKGKAVKTCVLTTFSFPFALWITFSKLAYVVIADKLLKLPPYLRHSAYVPKKRL